MLNDVARQISTKKIFLSLLTINLCYVFVEKSMLEDWGYRRPTGPVKTILLWNNPERIETSSFGFGWKAFIKNNCPVSACQILTDRNELPFDQYDAVVMNMHVLNLTDLPEQFFNRSSHQRYVFMTQESPQSLHTNISAFANYFNWTMNFQSGSDIPLLYGRIRPKPSAPNSTEDVEKMIRGTHTWAKNYASKKSRTIGWMVSHCTTPGLRESYIKELSNYIEVDIYGKCGNLTCPRNEMHWLSEPQCYDMLAKNYKFYLSFENSVCTDYVTEKFFNILTKDLVPVVYGGANYSSLAPAHSFIDAMQFTPRQLAEHLSHLAANDTLYNEFFWWKEHYEVEAGVEQMARHGFCDLCKKLHQDSTEKVYEKIKFDWSWIAQCKQMASWLTGS